MLVLILILGIDFDISSSIDFDISSDGGCDMIKGFCHCDGALHLSSAAAHKLHFKE